MKLYTAIGSHRFGRHGAPLQWFKTVEAATAHASDLLCRSQIGRSTRLGPAVTANIRLYIVGVEAVVEVPPQIMAQRKLKKRDIDAMCLVPSRR